MIFKYLLGGETLNIPNILTALRFILIPVFAYFLLTGQYVTGVILFSIAGLTDVVDGYIKWGKLS